MNWNLEIITVGPLQMNAVILTATGDDLPNGPEAILIDPGDEAERLVNRLQQSGCTVTQLLATHGHFDHVAAGAQVQKSIDLPLRCHADDIPVIEHMQEVQAGYGFAPTDLPKISADLVHGLLIPFAGNTIEVRHVPGHSPGQVMFIWEDRAIVGDCLFYDSIGRTDLPGGSFQILEQSIRDHIYSLPDETIVHCGHGPDTTVGREKYQNPFVQA